MKSFDDLTAAQKEDAIDVAAYDLMDHIASGVVEITLVDPASQARLQKILEYARKKESTRLIKLHLIHDKPIRKEVYRLALVAASGSQYDENGDPIKETQSETMVN